MSLADTINEPLAAERYLDALAALAPAGTLLDVRYRIGGHGLARFFVPMHAPQRAALVTRVGQRTDVYVGVAPRLRRSGRRDDVAPTALLWADCDSAGASEALYEFVPPANIVVASGTAGNAHGYWMLSEPVDVARLEELNRRLGAALGADVRCAEAARILRVPGTLSFKHTPPRPVLLRRCAGARYDPSEIDGVLPRLPEQPAPKHRAAAHLPRDSSDPLHAIAPPEYVRLLIGRVVGPDGKTRCPFHDDRTPSFHAYPTAEEGWTCFACTTPSGSQLGGDIYTLASLVWGMPASGQEFIELRRRLDALFGVRRG